MEGKMIMGRHDIFNNKSEKSKKRGKTERSWRDNDKDKVTEKLDKNKCWKNVWQRKEEKDGDNDERVRDSISNVALRKIKIGVNSEFMEPEMNKIDNKNMKTRKCTPDLINKMEIYGRDEKFVEEFKHENSTDKKIHSTEDQKNFLDEEKNISVEKQNPGYINFIAEEMSLKERINMIVYNFEEKEQNKNKGNEMYVRNEAVTYNTASGENIVEDELDEDRREDAHCKDEEKNIDLRNEEDFKSLKDFLLSNKNLISEIKDIKSGSDLNSSKSCSLFKSPEAKYLSYIPDSTTKKIPIKNRIDERRKHSEYIQKKKEELYKTEMCRSLIDMGHCKYGVRCQFAHNENELRHVERHPKYKTEICKTFWNQGECPYGRRCCFIHMELKENILSKVEVSAPQEKEEPEEKSTPEILYEKIHHDKINNIFHPQLFILRRAQRDPMGLEYNRKESEFTKSALEEMTKRFTRLFQLYKS